MGERIGRTLKVGFNALVIDFTNRDMGFMGVAALAGAFSAWCFTIALGIYGFEAHGAVGVGIVALVRYLPAALASPLIGPLIDRYPRRSIMLASGAASATVLIAAAAVTALGAPTALVFVFPALYAVASCGYGPAHAALTPTLVKTPQALSASNVTHSAMDNVGALLAALVAGFLLGPTSPAFVIAVAAAAAVLVILFLTQVKQDRRPRYGEEEGEGVAGAFREVTLGLRTLTEHPTLLLSSFAVALLFFFEGLADVLVVVLALDLLGLGQGSVGFLNATWGVGALVGAVALALLLDRGRLVVAIVGGSALIGAAAALPGISPEPVPAYLGWLGVGIGFVFVEVAAKTLMQRLGSDETFGRVVSSLEAMRLSALALGSIAAIALDELLGIRAALLVAAGIVPLFALFAWRRLRAYEVGAPVAEEHYRLLRDNAIFAPLPLATLERLSHDLVGLEVPADTEVIVQGEIGDQFFLIESGQVEVIENGVFRRREGAGESFGEIALLHDVPRTATVRTAVDTRLLALGRDQFLLAVTGHRRSHQLARAVVGERWPVEPGEGIGRIGS